MGSKVALEQGAWLLVPEVAFVEVLSGLKGKVTSAKQGQGGAC